MNERDVGGAKPTPLKPKSAISWVIEAKLRQQSVHCVLEVLVDEDTCIMKKQVFALPSLHGSP
jgi:hypothetical protein